MGGAGAVQILHGRHLATLDTAEQPQRERELVDEYEAVFAGPYRAAERGFVDAVIEPAATRHVLTGTLDMLATKRHRAQPRNHSNGPL
jgi:acetyl-CoA carboxylase carboxyltransferase component